MITPEEIQSDLDFCNEMLQGQKDCRDGVPHREGMGENYDIGYSTQYQHEANMNALELRL